ncbi:endoglucanase [Bacillus mesophilus]|uniref:M42 family metallopeptidase n=1 Tax=Bacillus mesophilus TaxID=1808955 RepID=A0A6M0Q571_9BACI|nr:M42 family metallopeptidase [Bacillus mesophilus]MBM7660967.1 endoglucanase [Bacillus mesophilus]NEY71491.1 M42 family metallopeptidase [Bacillus mesophilus]
MEKSEFLEQLKTLAAIQGAPGQEMNVVRTLVEQFSPYADSVEVDNMGNLYAYMKGNKPGPTVMVSAHSDEIGCVVRDIDERGFIRIERTGGMIESLLIGRKVNVNGHFGVVGVKAGHLQTAEERSRIPSIYELYVDVGAASKEEVHNMGIQIGDQITYVSEIEQFTNPDLICGKAIDNRSCCVLLLQLFKSLHSEKNFAGTLVGVIAVQEEVGLRGAKVATYKVNPEFAIVLDTIPCADTPDSLNSGYPVGIGRGPVFPALAGGSVRGNIMSPQFKKLLIRYANELDMPYQLAVMTGATTDLAAVHLEREGVLAGAITFARRYSHSPVEVANLRVFEQGFMLLEKMILDNENWGELGFI